MKGAPQTIIEGIYSYFRFLSNPLSLTFVHKLDLLIF